MSITIEFLEKTEINGGDCVLGHRTVVKNAETGEVIKGVTNVQIDISPNEIVTATMEVFVSSKSDMKNIHALLGTKTLEEVLKLHGIKKVVY